MFRAFAVAFVCSLMAVGGAASAQQSVNGISAADLDVTSVPNGVLSPKDQEALWNIQKTSKACLEFRKQYGSGRSYALDLKPSTFFASQAPQSAFPDAVPGLAACTPEGRQITRLNEQVELDFPPPPVAELGDAAVANYRDVYGASHPMEEDLDIAGAWFARHVALSRANPEGPDGQAVIDQLVVWAKARALTRNIQVGKDKGPVIFAVGTLGASLVNAYAELAPKMSADDRAIVGPWLGKFVRTLAANPDPFRTQNHAAGYSLVTATWGLATGDAKAVQFAIDTFKFAIHDMRPDGSFAQDHSRGANGLSYDDLMTGDLFLLAALLKERLGVDLFAYSVDGRSIHTAVEYVMGALADPVAANLRYALPCPQAGDYEGHDRSTPFVDYDPADQRDSFSLGAYLPAYALMFPDRPVSQQIIKANPSAFGMAVFHPMWHAAPICSLGLVPTAEQVASAEVNTSGAPRVVSGEDIDRMAKLLASPDYVDTTEMKSYNDTGISFNSIFVSKPKGSAGSDEISYNVQGMYGTVNKRPIALKLVLNDPIGKAPPKGLTACGQVQTDTYDDGQVRLVAALTQKGTTGDTWALPNLDCIAKALPKSAGLHLRFLIGHFGDIAKSMVASGNLNAVKNESLRTILGMAADGSLIVQ